MEIHVSLKAYSEEIYNVCLYFVCFSGINFHKGMYRNLDYERVYQ